MAGEHNVFITWSGDRSKWIAQAMYEWLPMVVQAARPFFSTSSIDKGTRGLPELSKALAGTKVAIVCLTSENKSAPWVLYEAGALSKTIDDKTRLCVYLLGGLQFRDVEAPLGMFQSTNADKEDTLRLIKTINKAVTEDPVPEKSLEAIFELTWPTLEEKLLTMPPSMEPVPVKRSLDDVVADLLELARSEAERGNAIADQLNYIEELVQSSHPLRFVAPPIGTVGTLGSVFRLPSAKTKITLSEQMTLSDLAGGPAGEKKDDKAE